MMQCFLRFSRFIPLILSTLILSACVSFSEDRWQDYAGGDLCAIQSTMRSEQQDMLPVFFITTRLPDCRADSYSLTIQRGDRIRHGRLRAKGTSAKPKAPDFNFQSRSSWADDIAAAAQSADGKVIFYIHGYNNTFADAAIQAQQIRYHSGFAGPLISYNWPSHAKFLRYAVDEANADWDRPYLVAELLSLAAMPEISEIILVAHSMGARSAVEVLDRMDTQYPDYAHKLRNIILASPDIDRQIFERQTRDNLLDKANVAAGRRITVFTSDNDRAVAASRFLHGYDRLGLNSCIDPLASPPCYARPLRDGVPIAGLTIIDTSDVSGGFVGHVDFIDSKSGREYFCEALSAGEAMMQRAYTIVLANKDSAPSACLRSDAMEL